MSLFGKQEQSKENYLRGREKAGIEKREKCQAEINAILNKYGLAIHATFHLVEAPKKINDKNN